MKKILYFLMFSTLLMGGCQTSKRMNFILVFDNSSSVPPEVSERYIAMFKETILPELKAKDKLSLLFADGCSENKGERIYDLDLAEMDFSNKRDGINHAADSAKARLRRYLFNKAQSDISRAVQEKRNQRVACAEFTDILSTLLHSEALVIDRSAKTNKFSALINNISGTENYEYETCIIIFSDMINENMAKTYDFTQFATPGHEDVAAKLKSLVVAKKLPDLSGVKVLVYGATSPLKDAGLAEFQNENVKLFWKGYFDSCGARLVGYGYDTKIEMKNFLRKESL